MRMSLFHSTKWMTVGCLLLLLSCKGGSDTTPGVAPQDSIEVHITSVTSHTFKNETCKGVVKSVSDGDTYNILLEGETTPRRVRMAAIDAPEKGQDFYRKSRHYLDSLIWKQEVTLLVTQMDSYGRLLAYTYLSDGREMSHEMVRMGYAWHYQHYDQQAEFDSLEAIARNAKIGLWSSGYPVEPWVEKALRKKGYKSDEIRKMKREGLIPDIRAAKAIPSKN